MEDIKDFGKFALKNKKIILNVFVLLCLTSIAVWDAAKIIDDYVNDNQMTLVKIETAEINGSFPFLQNDELQVCLSFRGRTILNELWNFENAIDIVNHLKDDLELAVQIFKNNTTSTEKKFSFDYRMAAMILIKALHDMDDNMMQCVLDKRCDNRLLKHKALDNVLKNVTLLDMLQNVWFERQNTLIVNTNSELRRILPLQYLTLDELCFYVPLSILTSDLEYFMGVVGNEILIRNNSVPFRIILYAGQDKMYDFYYFANVSYAKIRVAIRNIGVYSKKITTQCSDEVPLFRPSPYHYFDGYKNLYPKTFLDKCGCVPFRYQNFDNVISDNDNVITTTSSDYLSLPYCTLENYNNCIHDLRNELSSLPQCTIVKNQYSIVTSSPFSINEPYVCTDVQENNLFSNLCSHAKIIVHCSESVYAIYEARFQLNLAQLLSQVGGDIGLYTGISFLGLWQFFALAHAAYQSHKKARNAAKTTVGKLLVHYLDERMEARNANSGDIEQIAVTEINYSTIKDRMNRMEEKLSLVSRNMEIMQQRFEKRMNEMLQLIKEMRQVGGQSGKSEVIVSDL